MSLDVNLEEKEFGSLVFVFKERKNFPKKSLTSKYDLCQVQGCLYGRVSFQNLYVNETKELDQEDLLLMKDFFGDYPNQSEASKRTFTITFLEREIKEIFIPLIEGSDDQDQADFYEMSMSILQGIIADLEEEG